MRRLRHSDDERQLRMLPKAEMPKTKTKSEGTVKKEVLAYLAHVPDFELARTPSGKMKLAHGGWCIAGRCLGADVRSGWPDISGTIGPNGRSFYIETKTEIGALSNEQKECHARLRALGAYVAVCRSVEDAIAALAEARR